MPKTVAPVPGTSKADIFTRFWEGERGMPLSLAREVVKLKFSQEDRARMHDLAAKNSAGTITAAERTELESFVEIADWVSVLQSRARMAVKARQQRAATRG